MSTKVKPHFEKPINILPGKIIVLWNYTFFDCRSNISLFHNFQRLIFKEKEQLSVIYELIDVITI